MSDIIVIPTQRQEDNNNDMVFVMSIDIFELIRKEDTKSIFMLIRKQQFELERRDKDQLTPLLFAAKLGLEPIVAALLSLGADVKAGDSIGHTALHFAAEGGYLDCISTLIAAGANIDAQNHCVKCPLSNAASQGHTLCVALLLASGANSSLADIVSGNEPVHYAILGAHINCLTLLLSAGASVNSVNKEGNTPLSLTCRLKYDVPAPAAPDAGGQDNQGTPAQSSNPYIECAKVLIAYGARIDLSSGQGKQRRTPLHVATEYGNEDMIIYLHASRANMNARTQPDGHTALHLAAIKGDFACFLTLLTSDSDASISDEYGMVPVDYIDDGSQREAIVAFMQELSESRHK